MIFQGLLDLIERKMELVKTVPNVVEMIVFQRQTELLDLRRDQLLLGRNEDGEPLTPSYLDDPYFKSRKHAQAYADRKYALEREHNARIHATLNYSKDKNTPNLIVRGDFQDSMFIQLDSRSHTIGATYGEASLIERKYDNKLYGLAPLAKEYFWQEYLKNAIINHLMR